MYASGAAVVAVLWLILPGATLYYDVSPKAVALLAGLAALTICYRDLRADAGRLLASRPGRLAAGLLLCQVALLTLATAFSTSPALSLAGSNWRRMGWITEAALLVFGFLVACLRTAHPEAPLVYLRILAFAGVPVAGYAILQFLHVDPFLDPASYAVQGMHMLRPPSTMGHSLYLANVLVPMLVAAVALVRFGSRTLERRCAGGAALLLLAAIVLTDSRSPFLGLVAALAAAAFQPGPRRGFRLAMAAVAALVLPLAVLAAFSAGPRPLRMMYERWRIDPAGGTRLPVWRDSLRMAAEPRVLGTGPETFPVVFPAYWSMDLAVRYPNHYHESPHNVFLDVWLSRGAPACLVFMATIGFAFIRAWRATDSTAFFVPALLAAVVVAHLFSVFTIPDALVFYLILGLALGSPAPPDPLPRHALAAAWGAAGIRALAAYGVVFAAQLLVSERFLAASHSDFAGRHTAAALDHYAQAQTWQPAGACFDLWFARTALAQEAPDSDPKLKLDEEAAVLTAARRAAWCSEQRHNALLLLATVYARQGYDGATEDALRRAVAQAPMWYVPHFHLSQLLLRLGRKEEAVREAVRADDLSGGQDPRTHAYMLDLLASMEDSGLPGFPGIPARQ